MGERVRRYASLLALQVRTSLLVAMQYRWDFLIDGAISLIWTATALVPLWIVFRDRAGIGGWSREEALLVVAWFTMLQGVLEGAINPSVATIIEHIRKGTLDFVLLKPVDSQFLVSTAKFLPWRIVNTVTALGLMVVAFVALGRAPTPLAVLRAAVLFGVAVVLLYSLWLLAVSAAFYVVKIDNLTFLFGSIFDAARWPASVFKGVVAWVFTFVVPLALMTTYPAEALLGRIEPARFVAAIVGGGCFAIAARTVWVRSVGRYTSTG